MPGTRIGLLALVLAQVSCLGRAEAQALSTIGHAASRTSGAQRLGDLMAAAKRLGDVPAIENDYVRVLYVVLQYPAAELRVAESRPIVLYLRIAARSGVGDTRLLEAPRGTRPSWRPGVLPRGVHIELRASPPATSTLGEPGTHLPRGAINEEDGERYRLVFATFRPQDYGVGTGLLPSVTIFLSDGVVEVKSRGVRRRMGVQAGDAFWFDAATQLTVVDDFPVDVAIVQLYPR